MPLYSSIIWVGRCFFTNSLRCSGLNSSSSSMNSTSAFAALRISGAYSTSPSSQAIIRVR